MTTVTHANVTVGDGRKIELVVPDLPAGELVEVVVQRHEQPAPPCAGERPLGLLKGKIIRADDFDAPLDELDPYVK